MPEKCALSHGSGVLGRDPRDSCRFWSPHVENVCTVTQIRLGEGGGGEGGYHCGGGGGRRTENRDHIYIYILLFFTYLYHNVVQTSEDGRRESRGEANVLSCLSDEA